MNNENKYIKCQNCGMRVPEDVICGACGDLLYIPDNEPKKGNKSKKGIWATLKKQYQDGKLQRRLAGFIILFILFNFIVFTSVAARQGIGKVHTKAKISMSAAATINIFYVLPLSRLFGYENPVAIPFIFVRDKFYHLGLRLLPKDDGERELWWFVIRHTEFEQTVPHEVYNVRGELTPEKIKKYLARTDEEYQHLYPFSALKIKDENLKSKRYGLFIDVIWEYLRTRYFLVARIEEKSVGREKAFYYNDSELDKFREILDLLFKTREYTKKYEPEGYNHFRYNTSRYYYEDLIVFNITEYFWKRKIIDNSLKCDDPYLALYGKARKNLRYYLFDRKLPVNSRKQININTLMINPNDKKLAITCPNNRNLDLLRRDINYVTKGLTEIPR